MAGKTRWKVVIPDRITGHADVEAQVFGDAAEVIALGTPGTDGITPAVTEAVADADALLVWHDLQWDAATIGALTRCKVIVRVGAGFDNVNLAAAREKGIVVCNVPDYGTHDVADHAIALLLSLARGLKGYDRRARSGDAGWTWEPTTAFRLTGKTFGVVGLGRIGTAAAMRANAFGMRVIFYDPYRQDGWDKALGVTRVESLDALAAASDVVSVHTPLTPETRGMIGQRFFEQAKAGMAFINTARGPVVDWPAFQAAFLSRKVAAAGFDVLPVEPPDLRDALLTRWVQEDPTVADRLIITPHSAFYSVEAEREMREKAAREALGVLSGKPPRNKIN